ncbi:MAG: valine--tRNA ligase [Planctomycetota bacterium]
MDIPTRYNPKDIEERWYSVWETGGFFHAGTGKTPKGPYCIVIPPPNVTGILHMGHGLNMTLQDIVIRFRRMQGYDAMWLPGCDHAGIATEMKVKERLHKKGKTKHDLGREAFLEEVWAWKKEFGGTIMRQLRRLGCSCDWKRERFTLDEGLSRAVREVFVRLYEKGLIYRGKYIVNWCPSCGTALSDIEVERKDRQGSLWYVRYPLVEGKGHITIATTRPETILADVAVAVNPKDERYKKLVGKKVIVPIVEREVPIIADDMVELEFGTGALKITPAHDQTDFLIGQKHDLPAPSVIDETGSMNEHAMHFVGMDRFECREKFVEELKEKGLLEKVEDYPINIGTCYRCDAVVEPYLSDQWFVKMKPLARPAIDSVKLERIRIIPVRWEKVYYDWLENIRDWPISRQLWWGHRIPAWYCGGCGEINVAREEPEKCAKCGATNLRQEDDVLDTWFSSWLWPFSTLGWPDETGDLKAFYPTGVLITAHDIIFFWVARMIMAGLEFRGDVPFRDVYIHGLICDDAGQKMDKSRGNTIDPIKMIEKYGADAVRFTLALLATEGQNIRLSSTRFEMGRNFNNKLWNVARFVLMNLPRGEYAFDPEKLTDLKDRWIISSLNSVTKKATKLYESYRYADAANLLYDFVWHSFCDWYIELAKPDLTGPDEARAHNTRSILVHVLDSCLKLLHPIIPFITEEIWQTLRALRVNHSEGETIVLAPWPRWDDALVSGEVEEGFNLLIEITRGIRNIRSKRGITERKEIDVTISTHEQHVVDVVRRYEHYFHSMAGVGKLDIGLNLRKPSGCAVGVVGSTQIFVPLEAADIRAEIDRLEKQKKQVEGFLQGIEKRLANSNFVERAAPDVVEQTRQKREELLRQIQVLDRNISHLGAE